VPALFLDRAKSTCASALIAGDLTDIKALCRYGIYKTPYPVELFAYLITHFLFTNISVLQMQCFKINGSDVAWTETVKLTTIQSIHSFDCHCQHIAADEFKIIADLSNCNLTENILSLFEVRFPVNLAYLSEYFSPNQLYNLTSETLLNELIEIRLRKLALEDEQLNTYFGVEKHAHFDLATMINRTKQDAETYSSLAHYLFNEILEAHAEQSAFNVLNLFSWLTIILWVISVLVLILAMFLRVKVHSLTLLLLAKPVRAMPTRVFPKMVQLTVPTTTGASVTVDTLKEWAKLVPKLMPIELLILLCLFFVILFALVRMLYGRRRLAIARITLNLEIGDGCQSMVLPIIDLNHPPNCYRLVVNKAEINLHLVETNIFSNL